MCGIVIKHDGKKILSIKGDKDDPFSKGYICPKATADPCRQSRRLKLGRF
nr:hypothetical protein [Psychrobacter sp. Ps4]